MPNRPHGQRRGVLPGFGDYLSLKRRAERAAAESDAMASRPPRHRPTTSQHYAVYAAWWDREVNRAPLTDEHRARIVTALVLYGPQPFRRLVALTGLDRRTARRALNSTQGRGLVCATAVSRPRSTAWRGPKRPMTVYWLDGPTWPLMIAEHSALSQRTPRGVVRAVDNGSVAGSIARLMANNPAPPHGVPFYKSS